MSDVTQILHQIQQGDLAVTERLLPLVYEELRRLARVRMKNESSDHTLEPTALVHEAYLRLVENAGGQTWNSRGHFFAAAAEAMRQLLIDHAKSRKSLRRGGDHQRVELQDVEMPSQLCAEQLLAIHEVLDQLAAEDLQAAEIVKLRYFAGMSVEEAAMALGISRSTAYEAWKYARAWLQCALKESF